MKAELLVRTCIAYAANVFAELVLWRVHLPVPGSRHRFKYRLALVVDGQCVLRYDNEAGKGDHRHVFENETPYRSSTPEKLIADFNQDIGRWIDEDRDT